MASTSQRIIRLPDETIHRIAAGEVIQRPCHALKELLENALDAQATTIKIKISQGGLKSITVQDNGRGIPYQDLPLACERHATSKFSIYEEMNQVQTFGFRGEALASLSLVSHVTIQSKCAEDTIGYKSIYRNTELTDPPIPSACNTGTTIIVQDLFYNAPTRKHSVGHPSEEYTKSLVVVQHFAIHFPEVSFSCSKEGSTHSDIHTPGFGSESNGSTKPSLSASHTVESMEKAQQCIQVLYGKWISDHLQLLNFQDKILNFSCIGWISSTQCQNKKNHSIVFINNRLVECTLLRRSIIAVYNDLLPQTAKPWTFLSIILPSSSVDINVHPTKKDVKFLREEQVVESICSEIRACLKSISSQHLSQPIYSLQMGKIEDVGKKHNRDKNGSSTHDLHKQNVTKSKDHSYNVATRSRIDFKQSSLELYQVDSLINTAESSNACVPENNISMNFQEDKKNNSFTSASSSFRKLLKFNYVRLPHPDSDSQNLKSVQKILDEVEQNHDQYLTDCIRKSIFVGHLVDDLCLLQFDRVLMLCRLAVVFKECVFQSIINRFGRIPMLKFYPHPLSIRDLTSFSVIDLNKLQSIVGNTNLTTHQISETCVNCLNNKSQILSEYFSIEIQDGLLFCIPDCCGGYHPGEEYLPALLLKLVFEVNWTNEKECFKEIAYAVGDYFCTIPTENSRLSSTSNNSNLEIQDKSSTSNTSDDSNTNIRVKELLQKTFFSVFKVESFLKIPSSFKDDQIIINLATIETFYRLFERN